MPAGALKGTAQSLDAVGLVLDALGETYDYVVLHAPAPADPVTLRLASACDMVVVLHGGDDVAADLQAARAAIARDGGPAVVHAVPVSALETRLPVRRAA